MDRQEKHHEQHRHEREEHKKQKKLHEQEMEKHPPQAWLPTWAIILGVLLIIGVIVVWTIAI